MRMLLLALTGAGLLAFTGVAAAAQTNYYFDCTGSTKVQNTQDPLSWSTTAPTASYQSGAGCGSADLGEFGDTLGPAEMDFYGGGDHTGAIDTINVELHSLLLTRARASAQPGMAATLTVDGNVVYTTGTTALRPNPELSSTGLTEAYRISIARPLQETADGEQFRDPLVPGTGHHTIKLQFSSYYLDYQNVWVWGASEIPSHVEINPAQLFSPVAETDE